MYVPNSPAVAIFIPVKIDIDAAKDAKITIHGRSSIIAVSIKQYRYFDRVKYGHSDSTSLMHRRVRAFAVCHLQSGTGHAVLYSLQEDMYYVEMQCTNSYGHNKEPCWQLYIMTFYYQNMKKRLIWNKGLLSVFCTFLKRRVSYITWVFNYLMYLLS